MNQLSDKMKIIIGLSC